MNSPITCPAFSGWQHSQCLLRKAGRHRWTAREQAQVDSFGEFADTPDLLGPPPGQSSSVDSHWKRLCEERESGLRLEEIFEDAGRKTGTRCDDGHTAWEGRDSPVRRDDDSRIGTPR